MSMHWVAHAMLELSTLGSALASKPDTSDKDGVFVILDIFKPRKHGSRKNQGAPRIIKFKLSVAFLHQECFKIMLSKKS